MSASRWRRVGLGLLVLGFVGLVFTGRRVVAQAPVVQPPRVVSLPEVVVPDDVAIPESGKVEATVLVQSDGSAAAEGCDAEAALCALVNEALSRARFEPAQRDGVAVAVRIRVALRLARPAAAAQAGAGDSAPAPQDSAAAGSAAPGAAPDAGLAQSAADGGSAVEASVSSAAAPDAGGVSAPGSAADGGRMSATVPDVSASAAAAAVERDDAEEGYGARARVKQIKQPGMRRLELAELRDMPGAFGDPFRAVEVLPGIVPFMSGLPYFYVRGSPPAGSLYFYDSIPVPSLYHLGLGPAVIHPQMVGPIRLYSGVAPARYGRLTGGVVVGEGPAAPSGQTKGEAELRLLDVSAFLQVDALGGNLTVGGRYGYPGLVISLVSPEVSVAYWDYQLRYVLPLSRRSRLELVGLGSHDMLSTGDEAEDTLTLQFHRFEPRYIYHTPQDEFGVAWLVGWEKSALGETLEIKSTRLGPRAWYEHRFDIGARLRLSADAQGLWGGLTRQTFDDAAVDSLGFRALGNGFRSILGGQTELHLPLSAAFELQAGARVDAWLQEGRMYPSFDPRLRAIMHASESVDFHVAGGTTHQPAVPIVPLPGLADYASAQNLQSALQLEAGVGIDLPIALRAELQLFAHRYKDLVFSDGLANGTIDDLCEREDCMGQKLPMRVDGWSYGMELFLRRPFSHTVSGVMSYTLAWAKLERVLGLPFTPSWDVRHLVNLVLQWEIGGGFALGLRGFLRSGKSSGEFYVTDGMFGRTEQRLPGFFRGDLQFSYSWRTSWSRMRFGLEWFNFSISREAITLQGCNAPGISCRVEYAPAIFAPNLSLRANFN